MDNLIIGTAGHVDHGKTMLVKALTGVDTDRLKEEKERGISIELGFAPLTLPGGRRAGIVDVPGHERFIKNMLAGVGGIDLVLLVIAADEGVMPQTKEHMDIINLLQVERGVVVLTKIDLVDEEWLALVREEVAGFLKGTTLEGAPVVEVSTITGQGLDELVRTIDRVAAEVRPKPATGQVRLPVDRVFSVTGFGTVATGTLWSGVMKTGDLLDIMPAGISTRIRSLQVHGARVEEARAGQRVAVNLTGVEVEDVPRGSVLAAPGSLLPSHRLDVRLLLIPETRPLKHRARVRLHLGTAEILARVVLLDRDELSPGEKTLAQLELEEPAVAARGDRFVIRSYSPMHTIGGGSVIDPVARKHRRMREEVIRSLLTREKGTPEELLFQQLDSRPALFTAAELARAAGLSEDEAGKALSSLSAGGKMREIPAEKQSYFVSRRVYGEWGEAVRQLLQDYHREFPLREGFPKEELRSRKFPQLNSKQLQFILAAMEKDGLVRVHAQDVSLPDFSPRPGPAQERQVNGLLQLYRESGYQPPSWSEACRQVGLTGPQAGEILQYLLRQGALIRVSDEILFHPVPLQDLRKSLVDFLQEREGISVGEARDLWQTSRKYALPLLEYFDRERVTRRVGDKRVLARGLEQKDRP
ncbi:selenocysteine-specific translation elongation factor [Desulfofundulus thermobenzoicus]|uniref:Selenocysteine-specific elongation factor n=1 Tax=Desulfofundulus thermobenzoicus TaxID=29376 RepID=A0A6N7IPV8_9FIRM|nr:selenocysteine-specific translation elongation factor [Desulfofundulus thermobenzoicus]MQL52054.1 selenocysteine-specific translation elongation factor [Desulfofundulus thermobenzoicus]HHW42310.1 selenocysteine-specific translation elongation factor [Desulfotomaculum sp.]